MENKQTNNKQTNQPAIPHKENATVIKMANKQEYSVSGCILFPRSFPAKMMIRIKEKHNKHTHTHAHTPITLNMEHIFLIFFLTCDHIVYLCYSFNRNISLAPVVSELVHFNTCQILTRLSIVITLQPHTNFPLSSLCNLV